MENASKALIMAGSVLIALMILGALLLMFSNLNNYQNTGTQNEREAQVIEFNNQFETYNRSDVRGSDLYSLLNRAVNYNRRKSTKGTGEKDEGQYLAYEPMTITVHLGEDRTAFTINEDVSPQLLTKPKYTVTGVGNEFDDVYNTVKEIEERYPYVNNLALSYTKIYNIDISNGTEKAKVEAIQAYNSITGSKYPTDSGNINTSLQTIKEKNEEKEAVEKYYEYIQFKRAHFNCVASNGNSGVTYNQKTGRIISMNFIFTGKIE